MRPRRPPVNPPNGATSLLAALVEARDPMPVAHVLELEPLAAAKSRWYTGGSRRLPEHQGAEHFWEGNDVGLDIWDRFREKGPNVNYFKI